MIAETPIGKFRYDFGTYDMKGVKKHPFTEGAGRIKMQRYGQLPKPSWVKWVASMNLRQWMGWSIAVKKLNEDGIAEIVEDGGSKVLPGPAYCLRNNNCKHMTGNWAALGVTMAKIAERVGK